jgi:ribosomal silencing factor RsfS
LPKNSYQKYIEQKIDLSGNTQPYKVRISFTEPVQVQSRYSSTMIINKKALVKSLEFRIYTHGLSKEQVKSLIDNIKLKIEDSGYALDETAAKNSWKENVVFYRAGQTIIELDHNTGQINMKIDFSDYF